MLDYKVTHNENLQHITMKKIYEKLYINKIS